jgi:NAD(P)-dependent dehydrogenase (short-subunit alcohol dehydrogenase family)
MNNEPPAILITGANCGIGRQAARLLAERECDLVVTGRDSDAVAEAAVTLLPPVGRNQPTPNSARRSNG